MSLGHLVLPESRKVLREQWGYLKRTLAYMPNLRQFQHQNIVVESVGLITHFMRANTYHMEPWTVSVRGCQKETIIGLGFGLGGFGESPETWGSL